MFGSLRAEAASRRVQAQRFVCFVYHSRRVITHRSTVYGKSKFDRIYSAVLPAIGRLAYRRIRLVSRACLSRRPMPDSYSMFVPTSGFPLKLAKKSERVAGRRFTHAFSILRRMNERKDTVRSLTQRLHRERWDINARRSIFLSRYIERWRAFETLENIVASLISRARNFLLWNLSRESKTPTYNVNVNEQIGEIGYDRASAFVSSRVNRCYRWFALFASRCM